LAIDLILRPPAEHLVKLRTSLAAVQRLLESSLWEPATAEAYNAAFHCARALLASAGVAAATHAGTHQLLSEHFVKDGPLPPEVGRLFGHLMSDRGMADYGPPGVIDAAGAKAAAGTAARIITLMLQALPAADAATLATADAAHAELEGLRGILGP
jgi:uncharacterized protein (UPF0332 family)